MLRRMGLFCKLISFGELGLFSSQHGFSDALTLQGHASVRRDDDVVWPPELQARP